MKLQESGEMYLKTILRLSLQQSTVHSIDISEFMGFSKPSVSRAVSILRESGYITFHEDKSITLTETGREIATRLYERQVFPSGWKSCNVDYCGPGFLWFTASLCA